MNEIIDTIQRFEQLLADVHPVALVLIKAAVTIIAVWFVWQVLKRLLKSFEKKAASIEFVQNNPQLFRILRRAISISILWITGSYLIRLFNVGIITNVFNAFIIILMATPVKNAFLLVLTYSEKRLIQFKDTKVDDIVFDLLNKFAGAAIYATAIVLALDTLGVNVMPFIAGAGVAGIAIGFAAKDTLSNLIAGVLLIIDRPFEIGDRIEGWSAPKGSATWGDVIDIGLRATKIRTTDNIVLIIPNNEIMKRDIINYSVYDQMIRVRINIGVAYDANINEAKDIILRVAGSADWIAKEPPPKVVVRNFGESSVDLQARVWIKDARDRMNTISFVTDRVKAEFDKSGIEIPYPRRDITIKYQTDADGEKPSHASAVE